MSQGVSQTKGSGEMRETVDALCEYLGSGIRANRSVATGEDGFEGLVAVLLSALTGQSFHVAGSGLQQSGDAIDHTGRISLQSKAYFGENQPTVVSILGDLEAQLDSNEDLDVLVIALRELTAQKITTLQGRIGNHGIDLICLQCTEANPELLLLLASYWDRVSGHPLINGMPAPLQEAIRAITEEDTTKARNALEILKSRIQHCDWTYGSNRVVCTAYLRRRFGVDTRSDTSPALYPIELASAIPRDDSAAGFREWWKGDVPLLIAEGEEGCGKSWLLAQEAWRIVFSGNAMVLWLDSIHWQGAANIRDAVETAFRVCLGVSDSEADVCQRLYRKLESRWQRPTLLVLDGMNERSCPVAADRIIGSLFGQRVDRTISANAEEAENATDWRLPKSLRVVFSTRSLNSMPGNSISAVGDRVGTFRVPPFSDSEFAQVLSRNSLKQADLPQDATGLLHYPRFFFVFLRVRSSIPSTATITPSVIWWFDLLAKIESGLDPAVTTGLNLTNPRDAKDLLTAIADELNSDGKLSLDQLNSLFDGQYLKVRSQLLDSRLFKEPGRVSATLSDDHISLAWGLVILRLLQTADEEGVWALADRIHELLEPGLSDSRRALGILVALQLSLTGEGALPDSAVAAGILAWFCSHNIFGREDQLDFWCRHRLNAYRLFIEDLLISPRAGSPEKVAVAPLARLWRDEPSRQAELAVILRRWLLVTWSEGQPELQREKEWESIRLPVVPHHVQLRLTPIAMSILSVRPDESMLRALAECFASAHMSTDLHGQNRYPSKWPHKALEPLMRWVYTETVVPTLKCLENEEIRPDVKDAYQWLIGRGLGLDNSKNNESSGPHSVEAAIREHKDPRTYQPKSPRSWVYGMEFLAVRDDLPEIIVDARTEILNLFTACCAPDKESIDRWFFEGLWPWALRLDAEAFESACIVPLGKTLTSDKGPNYEILHFFEGFLWRHKAAPICDAILSCVEKSRDKLRYGTAEVLLELLLFHGSCEHLRKYLSGTENMRAERGHLLVNIMSTAELLRMLKPKCIVELARMQAAAICGESNWRRNATAIERLEYWITLWANASGEDKAATDWAINFLTQGCPDRCRIDFIRLLVRSAGALLPSLIRDRSDLAACLMDEDFLYMLRHGHLSDEARKEMMLLWAERGSDLLAHSGRLHLLRGDECGFKAWGHELLQLAYQCVLESDSSATIATCFELDPNGRVTSRGPVEAKDKFTLMCLGPNSWGLDEGVQPGYVEDPNAELEQWRASEEALRKWTGFALRDFDDVYALRSWSESYPSEFKAYCDQFFTSLLASSETAAKFGAFPHYLLAVMLQRHPADAYAYWGRLRTNSNSRVYTVYEAELVPSTAWLPDLNHAKGIGEIRRSTLIHSENDEAIMGLALHATRVGTTAEVIELSEQLLGGELSKDRALAVSALAWIWDESVVQVLTGLSREDPSSWVRDHASWALDVQRQDIACRRAYSRALKTKDEYAVSRELHIMRPALLPSCMVWREMEEANAGFPGADCSPRKDALIRHFWYHWDCVSNHRHDTKVLGRQMKEYLRGHKVDRLVEAQMAPWWTP